MGSEGQTSWQSILVQHTDRRNVPRQIHLWALKPNDGRTTCTKNTFKFRWSAQFIQDIVPESKALKLAQKARKLLLDVTKGMEEQVIH